MLKQFLMVFPALAMFAALASPALAIANATVTFIPDRLSADSSFIMVADPHPAAGESITASWGLLGPFQAERNNVGIFPKAGNKYACYFSNDDNESTCGPVPIKVQGNDPPRGFEVYSINQNTRAGPTVAQIRVGTISMANLWANVSGGNITVRWRTNTQGGLNYAVYYASNYTSAGYSGVVPYAVDGYAVDIPTGPGDYFLALKIIEPTASGDFGGMVVHKKILPDAAAVPAGTQASSLLIAPGVVVVTLNKSETFQKSTFSITNAGSSTLANLSVAVPASLTALGVSVLLQNSTIVPNGTVYYSIVIAGAQHSMEMLSGANVTSNNVTVGRIPLNITVSILNSECTVVTQNCPPAQTGLISVSPVIWTGSALEGTAASKSFRITNNGAAALANITITSDFGNSLFMPKPDSIMAGGVATVTANLSSVTEGRKSGTITISSPAGSAGIAVVVDFRKDVTDDLAGVLTDESSIKTRLTASQMTALSSAFTDIEADVTAANDSHNSGDYTTAAEKYNSARAKLDAISRATQFVPNQPVTPGQGIDMMTIILIAAVAALAAVAFVFIRKRRQSGESAEEELAEEFGPVEGA